VFNGIKCVWLGIRAKIPSSSNRGEKLFYFFALEAALCLLGWTGVNKPQLPAAELQPLRGKPPCRVTLVRDQERSQLCRDISAPIPRCWQSPLHLRGSDFSFLSLWLLVVFFAAKQIPTIALILAFRIA